MQNNLSNPHSQCQYSLPNYKQVCNNQVYINNFDFTILAVISETGRSRQRLRMWVRQEGQGNAGSIRPRIGELEHEYVGLKRKILQINMLSGLKLYETQLLKINLSIYIFYVQRTFKMYDYSY
ncbi:Hypothetical_protein [Hexamita inflata]|uniref:Hypothetical_protein n=1 Tax=Hexamita inflata TaxID=28002 RepID=A0AA86UY73_9EUKA|nr:Hypothetical protein HINF_LOCUS40233 [Hexamita inflata]